MNTLAVEGKGGGIFEDCQQWSSFSRGNFTFSNFLADLTIWYVPRVGLYRNKRVRTRGRILHTFKYELFLKSVNTSMSIGRTGEFATVSLNRFTRLLTEY